MSAAELADGSRQVSLVFLHALVLSLRLLCRATFSKQIRVEIFEPGEKVKTASVCEWGVEVQGRCVHPSDPIFRLGQLSQVLIWKTESLSSLSIRLVFSFEATQGFLGFRVAPTVLLANVY